MFAQANDHVVAIMVLPRFVSVLRPDLIEVLLLHPAPYLHLAWPIISSGITLQTPIHTTHRFAKTEPISFVPKDPASLL